MRAPLRLVLAALALAASSPALAQPSLAELEASKRAAGAAADAALEALNKGKLEDALAGFQRADQAFHTPKFLLFVARVQVKLGKLVDAKASYERVVAEPLPAYAQPEFLAAQADARKELAALIPRIPMLRLRAREPIAALKLDGKPVAAEKAIAVDPGEHAISGSASGRPDVERRFTLREGEARTETLEMAPSPGVEPVAGDGPNADVPPAATADTGPRRVPIATYAAYGIGAVGLVAGGVFGGLTLATKGDYDAARKQDPVDAKKVNGFVSQGRAFSAASDVGFAVGVAGAVVGTIVWIVSSRASSGPKAGQGAFIAPGAGGAVLGGSF